MSPTVGVIGAGVAATTIAHRMRSLYPDSAVVIFEEKCLEDHLAFGESDPRLLCNTSASVMSVDVESPDDFSKFLRVRNGNCTFPSRRVYGSYLRKILLSGDDNQRLIDDTVVCVRPHKSGVSVFTARRGWFHVDFVVITGGLKTPRIPKTCRQYSDDIPVFSTPYTSRFLQWIKTHPGSRLGILGTSLSGIDAARLALLENVETVMLSPSGKLPGVRTSLHVEAPMDISSEQFLAHSHSVEEFRRFVSSLASSLGWSSTDFSPGETDDGTQVFLDDCLIAEEGGSVWQALVGRLIDLVNQHWPDMDISQQKRLVEGLDDWMRRRVTAIPVESGKEIKEGLLTKQLVLKRGDGTGTANNHSACLEDDLGHLHAVDAVVCACGYTDEGWIKQGESIVPGHLKLGTNPLVGRVLSQGWGASVVADRVFFAGSSSFSTTAISNYTRTSVVQASFISDLIHAQ